MSWKKLLLRVNAIIPSTEDVIKSPKDFVPDVLSKAIEGEGVAIEWEYFRDWEDYDDCDIRAKVLGEKQNLINSFYVVDERVFSEDIEPHLILGEELFQFIDGYFDSNGVCFFNGDVIVVSKDEPLIFIFHHEGAYSWVKM